MREYVYSTFVNRGSVGILESPKCAELRIRKTESPIVHCVQTVHPKKVTQVAEEGSGKYPVFTRVSSRVFVIFARSEMREPSLALTEYPEILIKPTVQRMASMVMTTMSSTRVKP